MVIWVTGEVMIRIQRTKSMITLSPLHNPLSLSNSRCRHSFSSHSSSNHLLRTTIPSLSSNTSHMHNSLSPITYKPPKYQWHLK